MKEYDAKLLEVTDNGTLLLDINLGLNNIHLHKEVYFHKLVVPKAKDKYDGNKGLACKQRLSDLLAKAPDGIFRIKAEEYDGNIHAIVYIGGMNINQTLVNEKLAEGC